MIEKIVYKNNKEYYCGKISNKVIGTLDFGFEEFSEARNHGVGSSDHF